MHLMYVCVFWLLYNQYNTITVQSEVNEPRPRVKFLQLYMGLSSTWKFVVHLSVVFSIKSGFSETSAWMQTKFCEKLPIHHISRPFKLCLTVSDCQHRPWHGCLSSSSIRRLSIKGIFLRPQASTPAPPPLKYTLSRIYQSLDF